MSYRFVFVSYYWYSLIIADQRLPAWCIHDTTRHDRSVIGPRIIFTFNNVVLTEMASWPPCHIVNSTSDTIWERVKPDLTDGNHFWSPLFSLYNTFKGTVSWDFLLLVFSWISFPQASDYTIRAVSNVSKNSRRYSQLYVYHQCQMENIFNQNFFFFWTHLGSRVSI